MYTQSYVLPFLMPMLENAEAYTMSPRERDVQAYEVITDNDPSFEGKREGLTRRRGVYSETGDWSGAGTGFADTKESYSGNDNPFTMGTARETPCTEGSEPTAVAVWRPEIPKRGFYSVYISWKTRPNSSTSAHYTVRHLGGETGFIVNQMNVNDGTVEGVMHKDLPIFTCQYHPEASPGPMDTTFLFDRFKKMIEEARM